MLMAIDVGNTHTVIGVYPSGSADEPQAVWRIATDKDDTADDIRSRLFPLFFEAQLEAKDIHKAVMASVVPMLAHNWIQALDALGSIPTIQCQASTAIETGLFETTYPRPNEIGADRVADAVAAKALYGAPVIVADFGTATNMEVIDKDGVFIGGVIAPGVETSASALFSRATKLATVDLVAPDHVIGHSTGEAIRSGIVFGEAGRVDGLVQRIQEELGYPTKVIATGGLASRIAACSRTIDEVNPELTLIGLKMLAL